MGMRKRLILGTHFWQKKVHEYNTTENKILIYGNVWCEFVCVWYVYFWT